MSARGAVSATVTSVLVTGVTNLMVPVSLQAVSGTRALGSYAVACAVFTIALTMQRALATQVLLPGDVRRADAVRLALVCAGLAAASVAWGLGTCLLLPGARSLVWLVAFFPVAQLQDLLRFWWFSRRAAGTAAASDCTWFLVSVAVLLAGWSTGHLGPSWVGLAWGVGAAVALWPAILPRPTAAGTAGAAPVRMPWRALLVESAMLPVAGQLLMIGLVRTSGVEAVGQLRLAQVLLSANALALSTATAFLIPRLDLGSGARVLRASRLLGAGLLGLGLVVTGLVALDPLDVLRHLHTSATASLVATTAVLAASAALSGMSATRMVRIRRTVPARQWLPWRALAAYSEPAVGLSLSPAMGSVGAALGQLVNQLLLLVLVSRAPSADAPGGGAGAQGKPDPVGEALDHARH